MRAKIASLAAAPLIAGAFLTAPAAAQGLTYTRDVSATARTAYVFRGLQLAEENVKLNGELRFNGIHAGATWIAPLDDAFPSESQVYGAWSPHIEDHGSPIDFELGFNWYATPESAPGFADASRFEPYAKLYLDAPLMPSLAGYYDAELEAFTLEGRLTHYVPMGLNAIQFGFDGGLVSPDVGDERAYAQGSVEYIRNFLNGVEGFVGLRGAVSDQDTFVGDVTALGPVYDQDNKAWVSVGVAATF